LTLDHEGHWRFFGNQNGTFREMQFVADRSGSGHETGADTGPALLAFVAVCPIRLEGEGGLHLLALREDGEITTFKSLLRLR